MNYFENMNDFENVYGFENLENFENDGKGNEFNNEIYTVTQILHFFIGIFFLNQCIMIICYFDNDTRENFKQLYNNIYDYSYDFFYKFLNKLKVELPKKLLTYNGLWSDSDSSSNSDSGSDSGSDSVNDVIIPEIKYEDKYLDDIKQMSSEYKLTWGDLEIRDKKFDDLFYEYKINLVNEKYKINQQILEKSMEYIEIDDDYENISVDDINCDDTNCDENKGADDEIKTNLSCKILRLNEKKDTMKKALEEEIKVLRAKVTELEKGDEEMIAKLKKEAHDFVIKERLDKLKNNFIIEKTPLGNVIMYWNNSRESFEYYSDNTIPYRYLETVGRKYVKTFNCKQIYVDMSFELNEFERKQKEKKEKQEEELKLLEEKKKLEKNIVEQKKDVFAKFKTYNKESGTGKVNRGAAPPKNSIPNNNNIKNADEKVILKEHANRYTCEGKLSNFNFLKKPDRKVVDKKYAMSFSDFKKLKLTRL